jgi:hypothetical protein
MLGNLNNVLEFGEVLVLWKEKIKKAFPLPENIKDKRKVIRVIAHRL